MIHLREDDILLDMTATNKEGALHEMAGALHQHCSHINLETLHRVVHEREQIGSTGVGNGVAIPHGKIEGLEHILLCFGRSERGVPFDSIDNQPVTLFMMILSPMTETDDYLKTLAQISRLLKQPAKRRLLRLTTSRKEIAQLFNENN